MTTIATDGKSIACDSYLTDNTISEVQKIFKVHNGYIGVAGTYVSCVQFVNWLINDDNEEPDPEGVTALLLTKDGVYCYEESLTPYKLSGKYHAIGSGEQAALAAMMCGKSPGQAVKIASKIDPATGGPILSHSL
jgi:hypothetical protein